jgi:hypothetical protein
MSFFHGFFRQKSFNCGFLPFYGMEISLIVVIETVDLTESAMNDEKLARMATMNAGSGELIGNYA